MLPLLSDFVRSNTAGKYLPQDERCLDGYTHVYVYFYIYIYIYEYVYILAALIVYIHVRVYISK